MRSSRAHIPRRALDLFPLVPTKVVSFTLLTSYFTPVVN
jgi:hypothetical protein